MATTSLSVCVNLPVLDISYKWGRITWCLWLAAFTSTVLLRFTHVVYLILFFQYVFVVVAITEQRNGRSLINKIMSFKKFHILIEEPEVAIY